MLRYGSWQEHKCTLNHPCSHFNSTANKDSFCRWIYRFINCQASPETTQHSPAQPQAENGAPSVSEEVSRGMLCCCSQTTQPRLKLAGDRDRITFNTTPSNNTRSKSLWRLYVMRSGLDDQRESRASSLVSLQCVAIVQEVWNRLGIYTLESVTCPLISPISPASVKFVFSWPQREKKE